jgi:hypothetical protein
MDIQQYCPHTIQWTFDNIVHRLFKGHLTILSTDYSKYSRTHHKIKLHLINTIICNRLYIITRRSVIVGYYYWAYSWSFTEGDLLLKRLAFLTSVVLTPFFWYFTFGPIVWEMKKVLRRVREERNMIHTAKKGRPTGLVISCVGTAFWNTLLI